VKAQFKGLTLEERTRKENFDDELWTEIGQIRSWKKEEKTV
jgi:hypothetical protein